jgi:hypothetical protein
MRNPDWLPSICGQNRSDLFRQVSESELRRLEDKCSQENRKDPKLRFDSKYTFDTTLEDLNNLLEHVEIVRSEDGYFKIRDRHDQNLREAASLSSGESELISLGIEVLSYAFASEYNQYAKTDNWFLFDEPDVHLHPDLQHRLMRLFVDAAQGRNFRTLIATHSTTIVSALGELTDVHVAFMGHRQRELNFEAEGPSLKAVMPIFGAHPLSNVFNRRPILLVEGEDDERVWQQASRTSQGEINVWPCPVSGIQSLNEYEEKGRSILDAVYDDAVAFSLRDRDDDPYHIDDLGPVIRMRLNCRASENLILTDDVLELLDTDWDTLKNGLEKWLTENDGHVQYPAVLDFKNGGWDRRNGDLKPLRVLFCSPSLDQINRGRSLWVKLSLI